MRTMRLPLTWTVMLALVGGMSGTVWARSTEAPPVDPPHQVTGQISGGSFYHLGTPTWNEQRQVEERRGSYWDDHIEMDDRRLSGRLRTTWNRDTYGGPIRAGNGEVYAGAYELVNDDGTWIGTSRGYVAYEDPPSGRHHYWHFELTGTGAYEGNTALLYAEGPQGGPFAVEGFVFPGPLPEYPAELPAE